MASAFRSAVADKWPRTVSDRMRRRKQSDARALLWNSFEMAPSRVNRTTNEALAAQWRSKAGSHVLPPVEELHSSKFPSGRSCDILLRRIGRLKQAG